MRRSFVVVLALLLHGLFGSLEAARAQETADDASTEVARQAFDAGLAAMREERWVVARRHFQAAYEVTGHPLVLVNLALAQWNTDLLLESARSYERFLSEVEGSEGEQMVPLIARATEALETLRSETPRLTIDIPNLAPGDEVRLDDVLVAELDRIAVNPGEHTVTVTRGEERIADRSIAIGRNDALELDVPVPSAVRLDRPVGPLRAPPPPPADDTGMHTALVVIASIVAATGVVFLAVGLGAPEALGIEQPHVGNIGPGTIVLP